jgi:hypothetical protein
MRDSQRAGTEGMRVPECEVHAFKYDEAPLMQFEDGHTL